MQYAVTVALNYQNIEQDPQRISEVKSFIHQYDWKEMSLPSNKKDWEVFVSKNKPKHNLKHKIEAILLMITDGKKWHYLAVKNFLHCLKE